jgi:biotin carboxylase
MSLTLAEDKEKYIILYINDFFPEFATAFTELSKKLDRPLRGIMLIDTERKKNGKNLPDKDSFFEEIVVDFFDDAALKKVIKPLEDHLLLVSCDSERSQLYFKQVIPHVPYVNAPTERSIDFVSNKGIMREQLLSCNRDLSPNIVVVSDASQDTITRVQEQLTFPVIIKPTSLDGSTLVNKANDVSELQAVLSDSFAVIDEVHSKSRGLGDRTMLIEEFIDGDLYTTDTYVDESGKVYILPFIHSINGAMAGLEGYQTYQSDSYTTLTDAENTTGHNAVRQLLHAIGLRSSVAHIDIFHTPHGWKIVEVGARPGAWRQEIYKVSYGIDHALNELLVKIGMAPDMPTTMKAYGTVFKKHASERGVVETITGIEEARANPSMYTLSVEVEPGDAVLPNAQGGSVLVSGVLRNTNLEQLNRDVATVRNIISVKIKKN